MKILKDDATRWLQERINSFKSKDNDTDGELVIPGGTYPISETLDFGKPRGGLVRGYGSLRLATGGATKHTCLQWVGPPGGTVIRYAGTQCAFRDFSVYGRGSLDMSNAQAGLLWHNVVGPGQGSGKNEWNNISFCNADVGMQCGESPEEGQLDYMCGHRLFFRELGTAYHVINRHSVGHHFTGTTYLSKIDKAFVFDGGGSFRLDKSELTEVGRYLELPELSNNVGINNATYSTGILKYDNKIGSPNKGRPNRTPEIVYSPGNRSDGSREITFDSIRMWKGIQLDDGRFLFTIGGDTFLRVMGGQDFRIDRPLLNINGMRNKEPAALFAYVSTKGFWNNPVITNNLNKIRYCFHKCRKSESGAWMKKQHRWEDR